MRSTFFNPPEFEIIKRFDFRCLMKPEVMISRGNLKHFFYKNVTYSLFFVKNHNLRFHYIHPEIPGQGLILKKVSATVNK